MNYVITYWVRGNKFQTIADDDMFAMLEERQDNGELYISEVLEAPGTLQ